MPAVSSPDPLWKGPVGIDVSKHQGEVRWDAVRSAGYDFAFIKASEGKGYTDPRFTENWARAQQAGLLVGGYHFARISRSPTIEDDARAEAKWFAQLLQAAGSERMLPPVLDVEWDKKVDKVIPGAEVVAWCVAFTKTIEEILRRRAAIYTGSNFWKWRLLRTQALSHLPLWQVHYTAAKAPRTIPNWPWTFWQWSYQQPLPGSRTTKVDANRYRGTLEQLHELAGHAHVPTDPETAPAPAPAPVPEPAPWWDKLLEITDSVTRAILPAANRGGDT